MEKIISYEELPFSKGDTLYFRMDEIDPKLYISLLYKGYKLIDHIDKANEDTIFVTGKRQDYECSSTKEYEQMINSRIIDSFKEKSITKPATEKFSYSDLINYKYRIPFVLKNEKQNGGREKFLIATEADYENLMKACNYLIERNYHLLSMVDHNDLKYHINYDSYLNTCFFVQEYIVTPTDYNTTVRLLTSASKDLLYGSLKYNEKEDYFDDTTLLGYLLKEVFPLSSKSIVSNTLSGGKNILIDDNNHNSFEKELLDSHYIFGSEFNSLIEKTKDIHEMYKSVLGIICGFDYIYDFNKGKWYFLEYHSRPMLNDYSKRQGLSCGTYEEMLTSEGRIRATALNKVLQKKH